MRRSKGGEDKYMPEYVSSFEQLMHLLFFSSAVECSLDSDARCVQNLSAPIWRGIATLFLLKECLGSDLAYHILMNHLHSQTTQIYLTEAKWINAMIAIFLTLRNILIAFALSISCYDKAGGCITIKICLKVYFRSLGNRINGRHI